MSHSAGFLFRRVGKASVSVTHWLRTRALHSSSSLTSPTSNDYTNMTEMNAVHKPIQPILVSIEGNIGAGKTTILKALRQRHPEWVSIDEPVDTWSSLTNEKGESILEIFYKDRRRWSYTFQNCALLTRFQNIERAVRSEAQKPQRQGKVIFLTERCLETDYHVFTRMLLEEGSIDTLEIELYERLLKQLTKTSTPLSAIVHINTHPELCAQRIQQRARHGEEGISMDYLQRLDKYQVGWVNSTHIPTLVTHSNDLEGVESFIHNLSKP